MSKESIIRPLIKVDGEDHILEEMERDGEMPVLTAVGYAQLVEDKRMWVSYTVRFQGDKVLSIDVSEPDFKLIAEDSAKVAFVQELDDERRQQQAEELREAKAAYRKEEEETAKKVAKEQKALLAKITKEEKAKYMANKKAEAAAKKAAEGETK